MILKVVRKESVCEYYDGSAIVRTYLGKKKDSDASCGIQVLRDGKISLDHELYTGDVAYVLENGKTVDSFQG